MTEEEYLKKQRKRKARAIQKETGVNYTTALRQVNAEEEAEQENGEA
jgi:hypothetical protein